MEKISFSRSGLLLAAFVAIAGVTATAPAPLIVTAQAAPKVPASLLITTKSIGPARLGRTVAALKKAFPGSVVTVPTDGPAEFYTLKKNGRDLIYFVTRESATGDSGVIRTDDTVISMWTSDPHFKTVRRASGRAVGCTTPSRFMENRKFLLLHTTKAESFRLTPTNSGSNPKPPKIPIPITAWRAFTRRSNSKLWAAPRRALNGARASFLWVVRKSITAKQSKKTDR